MTITASIERLTPLSYVHDEPKIQTESERGAYIVGFHRARTKALQVGAQYEEEIDELCEALDDILTCFSFSQERENSTLGRKVRRARSALTKATGGDDA